MRNGFLAIWLKYLVCVRLFALIMPHTAWGLLRTPYPKYNNHFPRSYEALTAQKQCTAHTQPCLLRKCQYDFSPIYLSFHNCMWWWSAIYIPHFFFSYYEKLFVIPLEGGGLSLLVSFSLLPLNILGGSNRDPSIIVCSPILLTLMQINRQHCWGASILKV